MICLISLILLKKFIMQTLTSTALAHAVIETLLDNLQQHLKNVQLKQVMMTQLRHQSLFCIFACFDLQTVKPQANDHKTVKEDQLQGVPHITKDRLMPKEIENEQAPSQMQNRSSISKTYLGNKKISTLSNRNTLNLSKRPSSLLSRSQRFEKSQEIQQSQCKQLKSEAQIDDPEIQNLRERTELRLQYDLQYRKLQKSHEKSYRQKSEIMSSFLQEEPSSILTHDYDGQQIKSVLGDDKIKHYTLRMGVGPSNISARDHKKSLQPLQNEISFQRNLKERELHRNLRPMEMPLFQQPKLQVKITGGIESYRLHEYKKHFGRGYSRLDSLSKTIEYTNSKDQEDYFTEKRHLKDTLQTNNIVSPNMQNSRVARRLALPKLHGRYKVLDRYEQQ